MSISLVHRPLVFLNSNKFSQDFSNPPFQSKFLSKVASFKCLCLTNEDSHKASKGFSVLNSDVPCDIGDTWSTMALYLFSLHVPLSFGGLSVVAQILHQPILDPQIEALSVLLIQTVELSGTLLLLSCTTKQRYKLLCLFQANELSEERNWLLASLLGFIFLALLIFLTSLLADRLIGPKGVNNPVLKDILTSGSLSRSACILAYCLVTPLLEETVYRGFLLTSLASSMKWQQAVVISSALFSAAHFSCEDFFQLFIIGIILGCSYCWTGNLSTSVVVHSLYNLLTLFITFVS